MRLAWSSDISTYIIQLRARIIVIRVLKDQAVIPRSDTIVFAAEVVAEKHPQEKPMKVDPKHSKVSVCEVFHFLAQTQ